MKKLVLKYKYKKESIEATLKLDILKKNQLLIIN